MNGFPKAAEYPRAATPPSKTVALPESFTSGTYPATGAAAGRIFNAAEQAPGGTDNLFLNVHPVDNAAGEYYLMPLLAGGRNACTFDFVVFADSTVDMADITLFEI